MKENQKYYTLYSDVEIKEIDWLWYPYLALGKITLLLGNPDDGISTMMTNVIASLSKGEDIWGNSISADPIKVVYQCSEDDEKNKIMPCLLKAEANCENIYFIPEITKDGVSVDDEILKSTIELFRPKLVVINSIQAYIKKAADMQNMVKVRKFMKKIGLLAEKYNCAIVLIGKRNKRSGTNEVCRFNGSIDFIVSSKIALQVEADMNKSHIKSITQLKNNLAPKSAKIYYSIDDAGSFKWMSSDSFNS